ncbi:MAG: acyl carrier protein [Bacteroidia bacterium]|nr:acyl carrier protein [Bacteroidia bacterium]
MQKSEIIEQVNKIFVDVLDNDAIVINETTSAADVDEWDSLTHIQLVVAIEKHFKLKFTSAEIRDWKNVGEMSDTILQRLN